MILRESSADAIVIALSEAEGDLLKEIFADYPLVANDERELTRSAAHEDLEEDTELLRSSIAESNQISRRRLDDWLNNPQTFLKKDEEWLLRFEKEQLDWMLQILNDLRIGSWQQLKCPSQDELSALPLSPDTFKPICTMEMAGALQAILLIRQ